MRGAAAQGLLRFQVSADCYCVAPACLGWTWHSLLGVPIVFVIILLQVCGVVAWFYFLILGV